MLDIHSDQHLYLEKPELYLPQRKSNQQEAPLLSVRDIMDFLVFKFYKQMTPERMLNTLRERHRKGKTI